MNNVNNDTKPITDILDEFIVPSFYYINSVLYPILRTVNTSNIPEDIGSLDAELINISGKDNNCAINAFLKATNSNKSAKTFLKENPNISRKKKNDGFDSTIFKELATIARRPIVLITIEDPINLYDVEEKMICNIFYYGTKYTTSYLVFLLEGNHYSYFKVNSKPQCSRCGIYSDSLAQEYNNMCSDCIFYVYS